MESGDCPTLNMNAKENYLFSQSLNLLQYLGHLGLGPFYHSVWPISVNFVEQSQDFCFVIADVKYDEFCSVPARTESSMSGAITSRNNPVNWWQHADNGWRQKQCLPQICRQRNYEVRAEYHWIFCWFLQSFWHFQFLLYASCLLSIEKAPSGADRCS